MVDLSLIEFGVYGYIAYGSLLMLMISTIKDTPTTASHSIPRFVFLMPGLICAALLAGADDTIILESQTVAETFQGIKPDGSIVNLTSNETHTSIINLQDSVWVLVHFMIFIVLLIHIIFQSLSLLIKRD